MIKESKNTVQSVFVNGFFKTKNCSQSLGYEASLADKTLLNTISTSPDFLKKKYGLCGYFSKLAALRLERRNTTKAASAAVSLRKKLLLVGLSNTIIPRKKDLLTKHIANVCMLDFLRTYRGWRHIHGLPARGQRT